MAASTALITTNTMMIETAMVATSHDFDVHCVQRSSDITSLLSTGVASDGAPRTRAHT